MNQVDVTRLKLLRSRGCFAYLERNADDAMREIFACREDFRRILSQEAAEQMKRQLLRQLNMLHLDVLFELLLEEIKKFSGNDGSMKLIGDAASELGERLLKTTGAEVYKAAPMLLEAEQKITEHFITAQTEFLSRFCEMRGTISENLFRGKPVTLIRSLHHWGAPRWQGRMPVGVETDVGTCYYKPRDCRIDIFYHDLVKMWFSDALEAPSVVLGDGYGFCSEIVLNPVTDLHAATVYVRNLGILMAVFTCLNGNDLKSCNIIPCGTSPAAIDVETLLRPRLNDPELCTFTKTEQSISSSVIFTRLLFHWDYQKKRMDSQFDKYAILSDTISDSDFEELLILGFREGYFRILRIREELAEEIKSRGNMVIRVLFGKIRRNVLITQKAFEAPYLKSLEKKEELLEYVLKGNYGMEPEVKKKLLSYDKACFSVGEIPVYSARIFDRALYGKDSSAPIAEDMFTQSPWEHLQERLSRMSPEECAMNEEIIRRLAMREAKNTESERISDYSWEIYRELIKNALRAPDGTLWWYSESSLRETERKICLCFLQADAAAYCSALLYKGMPDESEKFKTVREIRNACLTAIGEKISLWETVDTRLELPAGLLQGVGELLLDLALMERLGCADARDTADRLLKLLARQDAYRRNFMGLMNGVAGLVAALCFLPVRKEPEAERLRLLDIRKAADALLTTLRQSEKKNAIVRNLDPFYGSTGAGMALLLAAEVLKGEQKAAEYTDTGIYLFTGTCEDRYAEGTGLCAAAAMWFCQSLTTSICHLQECLDWAMEISSGHKQPAPDDTLFHGNALRALFWKLSGEVLNQPAYRKKAAEITEEIQSKGMRDLKQFDASLLKGDLGPGLLAVLF